MSLSAKQLFEDEDDFDLEDLFDEMARDFEVKPMLNIRPAFQQLVRLGYRLSRPWSESDIYGNKVALKNVNVSYDRRTRIICFEPASPYNFAVVIHTASASRLCGAIVFPVTPAHFQRIVLAVEKSFTKDNPVEAEHAMRAAFRQQQ